jgi:hypothetical protein
MISCTAKTILLFSVIVAAMTGCTAPVLRSSELARLTIEAKQMDNNNHKVCIERFETPKNTSPENIVGKASVGFFNVSAKIKADMSVEAMTTNLAKKAFAAAGFAIAPCSEADFSVRGTFDKIWVDEYATGFSLEYAKSHVKLDVIINNKSGKTIWANSIDKFETSPDNLWDATSSDIPTLKSNLKHALEAVFMDESFWNAINTAQ